MILTWGEVVLAVIKRWKEKWKKGKKRINVVGLSIGWNQLAQREIKRVLGETQDGIAMKGLRNWEEGKKEMTFGSGIGEGIEGEEKHHKQGRTNYKQSTKKPL